MSIKDTIAVNVKYSTCDKYCGRGSKWGNPYVINVHGTRKQCIDLFKIYLINNKELMDSLDELIGLRLGCNCKPKPCHVDVIIDVMKNKELYDY
jgi:hypothetical protein